RSYGDWSSDVCFFRSPAEASHRFNLSSWTLRHQALVVFLLVLVTFFGILSYGKLAQSEDPPFTFKVMVIRTFWPGASARQVQERSEERRVGKECRAKL